MGNQRKGGGRVTENEIMIALRAGIITGLQSRGMSYAVEQSYQPGMRGTNTDPTIYIHYLGGSAVGWPERLQRWDEATQQMLTVEKQLMTCRIQIGATAYADLTDPRARTVSDVIKSARWAVQSYAFIMSIKKEGLSVFRVAELPSMDVLSDTPGYDKRPTFDIILQYSDVIETVVPSLDTVRSKHRVI